MLRFDSSSWTAVLFAYVGGIFPIVLPQVCAYAIYASIVYYLCVRFDFEVTSDGMKVIASGTIFMLVFRLNQCYTRVVRMNTLLATGMSLLRSIITFSSGTMLSSHPGEYSTEEVQAAEATKVHICRLCIAMAVSLKYHMRVQTMRNEESEDLEWESIRLALSDLVRIKALLTDVEANLIGASSGLFEDSSDEEPVTGCCGTASKAQARKSRLRVDFNRSLGRQTANHRHSIMEGGTGTQATGTAIPPLIAHFLRMVLLGSLGKRWGIPANAVNHYEKCMGNLLMTFQQINQMLMVRMPFPYIQLCKVLLVGFLILYPIQISIEHGIYGNVLIPSMVAFILIGLESVASLMDNPVGDDHSDISVYEIIHEFEVQTAALFNTASQHRTNIVHSWKNFATDFGIGDGNSELPKWEYEMKSFDTYFEWTRLPNHTIDYIGRQSADITSLGMRRMPIFTSLCCCRRRPSGGKKGNGYEEINEGDLIDHRKINRYAITHCLALRSPEVFHKNLRKQSGVLERTNSMEQALSFRETLAKSFEDGSEK